MKANQAMYENEIASEMKIMKIIKRKYYL